MKQYVRLRAKIYSYLEDNNDKRGGHKKKT